MNNQPPMKDKEKCLYPEGECPIHQTHTTESGKERLAKLKTRLMKDPKFKEAYERESAPTESEGKKTETTRTYYGEDEIYCRWYTCDNCKDQMITPESNFCPNCGLKIIKDHV